MALKDAGCDISATGVLSCNRIKDDWDLFEITFVLKFNQIRDYFCSLITVNKQQICHSHVPHLEDASRQQCEVQMKIIKFVFTTGM